MTEIGKMPEWQPRPRRRTYGRRRFLKLAGMAAGVVGAAALGVPEARKPIGEVGQAVLETLKPPEEDSEFFKKLSEREKYFESQEKYQVGQKFEQAVVTHGGFPDVFEVRVRAGKSLGKKEIAKLSVGSVIKNGEIVKGGYVPHQGGWPESNRWLKFKLEIAGKEKTGYISAIFIAPQENKAENQAK